MDNTNTVQDYCKPSVSKTMKHELVHFAASVLLAGLIFFVFDNVLLSFFTFAVCMFLDGDHLFDYFLYLFIFKKTFNFTEFLSGSYFAEWKTFIVPLHSWEMFALLAFLYFTTGAPVFIAVSLALAVHYMVDYFTNDVNKKAYFIFFRAQHGFKKSAIKPDF